MRCVTIFIDYEGVIEVPYRPPLDMNQMTHEILRVLKDHSARSTFNVVGKVAEVHPNLIKRVSDAGHEIASHSWSHDNVVHLSRNGLRSMLLQSRTTLERCTGKPVDGFRSPWLLKSRELYSSLNDLGFKWVSNSYFNYFPELYTRPDEQLQSLIGRKVVYGLSKALWKRYRKMPYRIGNLTEVPMLSAMDGHLLGKLNPDQPTPRRLIDYAIKSILIEMERTGWYFNINLHDWIIGSENRLEILDKVLETIRAKYEVEFLPARESLGVLCSENSRSVS